MELFQIKHILARIPDDIASLKYVQKGLKDLKISHKYNIKNKTELTNETEEGSLKLEI